VVCIDGWHDALKAYARQFGIAKLENVVSGGLNGQDSIHNGLYDIVARHNNDDDIVLIHDAIRPMVSSDIIDRNIETCKKYGNAITVIPCNAAMLKTYNGIETEEQVPRDNLKETVKSLITIREIANMGYLIRDQQKCIEAQELATALMGWSMNPAVISATKWGIIAAWAYSESILDVRALLEGRKIAWIKNAEQWTTGINQTSEAVDGFAMAKDCENGWDYMKYLKFLVSMKKNSAVNYRSMDIIEVNTSAISGKSIQMDHMMTGCESEVTYEAEPLFWNLITIKTLGMETFRIDRSNQYTYF